jgi:hypothetical protein
MKRLIRFVAIAVILIVVAAFTAKYTILLTHIRPPSPDPLPISSEPPSALESKITIPFRFDLDDLQQLLEKKVPHSIAGSQRSRSIPLSNGRFKYEFRRGPIALTAQGERLVLSCTINGHVTAKGDLRPGVGRIPTTKTVKCSGAISITVVPRVTAAWEIDPVISVKPNVTQAEATLLGVRISLLGKAKEYIAGKIPSFKAQIIKQLNDALKLRNQAELVWNEAHEPIKIGKKPEAWLSLKPTSITYSAFEQVAPREVQASVIVVAKAIASLDRPESTPLTPLPQLKTETSVPSQSVLGLNARSSLSQLENLLCSEVCSRELRLDNSTWMRISHVSLAGSGHVVSVGLDISGRHGFFGRFEGSLFLRGRILIDEKSQVVRVVDLDYGVNTKNYLVKAAHWLLKPKVLKDVESALYFHLDEYRHQITSILAKGATEKVQMEDFDGSLFVEDLLAKDIFINNKEVYVTGQATGKIEIRFTPVKALASQTN